MQDHFKTKVLKICIFHHFAQYTLKTSFCYTIIKDPQKHEIGLTPVSGVSPFILSWLIIWGVDFYWYQDFRSQYSHSFVGRTVCESPNLSKRLDRASSHSVSGFRLRISSNILYVKRSSLTRYVSVFLYIDYDIYNRYHVLTFSYYTKSQIYNNRIAE